MTTPASLAALNNDCFTVDVSFDEKWLAEALKTVRAGGLCRVAVVIQNAGPNTQYKACALGGGGEEYMIASVAGDFTTEPVWRGECR